MAVWVLDPFGHRKESGYIGKDEIKETELVLKAALEAKKHLERNGEKVLLTRNENLSLTIEEKEKFIRESKADILVIFRMNNDDNKNIKGVKLAHVNDDNEELYLAQLIKAEIQSELKTESEEIIKEKSPYQGIGCKIIIVYGEYLSNEQVMKEFSDIKYGYSVAKACLAYKDKVLIEGAKRNPKKMQSRAYRVCVGYYKEYDEAMNQVLKLNKDGIKDAYVVPYDGI